MKDLRFYIRHERGLALSLEQLKAMAIRPGLLKFVDFENFHGRTARELLGSHEGAVVLLESAAKEVGHYVLVFKKKDKLEYFDSYGLPADRLCAILGMDNKATRQFLSITRECRNDHVRLQARRADINTCGRYAVSRFNFRDMSLGGFTTMLRHDVLHPDDVITLLTLSADLSHWGKP